MERILYIWAIRHPASGYVQGINDLLTPLYVVFLSAHVGELASGVERRRASPSLCPSRGKALVLLVPAAAAADAAARPIVAEQRDEDPCLPLVFVVFFFGVGFAATSPPPPSPFFFSSSSHVFFSSPRF